MALLFLLMVTFQNPDQECIALPQIQVYYCTEDKRDPEMYFWTVESEEQVRQTLWRGIA